MKVRCAGLVRTYGRHRVLRGLDAEFAPGRAHAVVGPNGSGKTTLLRILAGLTTAEQGVVHYDDVAVGPRQPVPWSVRRRMGLLAHQSFAYRELTGRENLALVARLVGAPAGAVDDALGHVGLTSAADRPCGTYSRGMTQRLTLARLRLVDPPLLLLDEPTTGLDTGARERLLTDLRDAAAAARTVIVVTHDAAVVDALDAQVHTIERGRMAAPTGAAA